MKHPYISRTSNPDENYYRQTDPEEVKRKCKKSEGFLSYANLKIEYWTKNMEKSPTLINFTTPKKAHLYPKSLTTYNLK